LLIIALTISGAGGVAATPDFEPFTIEGYAKVRQVSELALSSDGKLVIYVVEATADDGLRSSR